MRNESPYNEGCIALVRHGYSDALASRGDIAATFEGERCLTFTAHFYVGSEAGFHDLWSALHQVKYYNGFSAGRIIACFRELEDISGTIPGVRRIRFGREYSPVMYIDCVSKDRAKELLDKFDYANPDEKSRTGKTIRLWWD